MEDSNTSTEPSRWGLPSDSRKIIGICVGSCANGPKPLPRTIAIVLWYPLGPLKKFGLGDPWTSSPKISLEKNLKILFCPKCGRGSAVRGMQSFRPIIYLVGPIHHCRSYWAAGQQLLFTCPATPTSTTTTTTRNTQLNIKHKQHHTKQPPKRDPNQHNHYQTKHARNIKHKQQHKTTYKKGPQPAQPPPHETRTKHKQQHKTTYFYWSHQQPQTICTRMQKHPNTQMERHLSKRNSFASKNDFIWFKSFLAEIYVATPVSLNFTVSNSAWPIADMSLAKVPVNYWQIICEN